MKILSIDHGTKRMGFAISDENHKFAAALPTLIVGRDHDTMKLAVAVVNAHKPDKILVGLPLGIENKPTQQSILVEKFCDKLQRLTSKDIVKWLETGSSVLALPIVRAKKSKTIDSESARIILQEYLDYINTGI